MDQPTSKKRILFVTTGRINPDGKLYYPPLVEAQIKSLVPFLEFHRVVIVYSFRIFTLWKTTRELKAKAAEVDIVHSQYGSLTSFLACLTSGGKPLIISFGGSDLLGTGARGFLPWLRYKFTFWLGHWAAQRSRRIIVKSRNLLETLPSDVRNKAIIIPNGVNVTLFRPQDKALARRKLQWRENAHYIVFTPSRANNIIVKNVTLASEVMNVVKQTLPDTTLELILDKSPEEIADMMNAADCLLLTSLHEGSPNVIKEAMACNLPVVTVNVGDVSERLASVRPSCVVNSYDPWMISQKILEILLENKRSNGHGEIKKQLLTEESIAVRILDLYNEIM